MSPQSKPGLIDKINILAVDAIESTAHLSRIVNAEHLPQVSVFIADATDFLFAKMAGTPADSKATFRRAMDQMSGSAQICR